MGGELCVVFCQSAREESTSRDHDNHEEASITTHTKCSTNNCIQYHTHAIQPGIHNTRVHRIVGTHHWNRPNASFVSFFMVRETYT